MTTDSEYRTLFTISDTQVKVKPDMSINLLGLWGAMAWLAGRKRPERSWPARLLIGGVSATAMIAADIGHAMAHTVSARRAGAPMDEIRFSMGMPRTIYFDNDVPPHVHRARALGGPIYNVIGLSSSLLLRLLAPRNSLAREIAGWSCVGQGFILGGALLPLPFVDAGTVLKWTLVEQGRTPAEADVIVREVDLVIGVAAAAAGLGFALRRRWLPALGLVGGGVVAIGAALDKIR